MNYLKPETLEFLIYLRYKNKPVDFNQFGPEKIKIVINDIIKNKIEKFFTFVINKQVYNPNLTADLIFLKQKIESKLRFGDSKKDYVKIKEIYERIINPPNTITFQEFKEIQHEIYRHIYKLFSLNLNKSEKENLSDFLKEYINLLQRPGETFYYFKKSKEKIFKLLQGYLKDCETVENPTFDIKPPYYKFEKSIETEFRFYDLILYLYFNEAISINDCNFIEFDEDKKLSINITLKMKLDKMFPTLISTIKGIKKEIIPLILPPHTKWENITTRFIDGENVEISVGKQKWKKNYKDMGFQNDRTLKPDEQWKLLEKLSVSNGTIDWRSSHSSLHVKKQKQLLSDSLKAYFKINESPFYNYQKEKAYIIKINLIP
jgi:hypothetical protein